MSRAAWVQRSSKGIQLSMVFTSGIPGRSAAGDVVTVPPIYDKLVELLPKHEPSLLLMVTHVFPI